MKYIIDTDPGIDDAIAIMLGYKNNLDILGFTIATGNIDKDQAINNLNTIQNILNINIPIYTGTKNNKSHMVSAEYAHGKDGLGNVFMPILNRKITEISAEDFIIESAHKYENDITIICLGPLTNLASAIKKDESIVKKIAKVIIMGTSYDEKIDKPYNEFNIKIDSKSATNVFETDFKRINIITHEIGIKTYIKKHYINSLKDSSDKVSKFIYLISQKYMEFSLKHYNVEGCCMPDPAAIASEINEETFKFVPCNINIKDDLAYVEKTNESNKYVASDVDLDKFTKLFENTFKK